MDLGDALDGEPLARLARFEHLAIDRDHRHAEAVQRHRGQRIDVLGHLAFAQAHTDFLLDGAEDVREIEAAEVERSEEHTSELQSLMRISYAVFGLKKKKKKHNQ